MLIVVTGRLAVQIFTHTKWNGEVCWGGSESMIKMIYFHRHYYVIHLLQDFSLIWKTWMHFYRFKQDTAVHLLPFINADHMTGLYLLHAMLVCAPSVKVISPYVGGYWQCSRLSRFLSLHLTRSMWQWSVHVGYSVRLYKFKWIFFSSFRFNVKCWGQGQRKWTECVEFESGFYGRRLTAQRAYVCVMKCCFAAMLNKRIGKLRWKEKKQGVSVI